jgi:hypothetical protein
MRILSASFVRLAGALALLASLVAPAGAQPAAPQPNAAQENAFSAEEIVAAGHQFFGTVSGNLATLVEKAAAQYGLPNGYILGQEASGAFFGGLRFGDGWLHSKTEPPRQVYWQGPSFGFDVGGDGDRTMMLVYDLPAGHAIFRRYAGVDGSAYLVGGLGMTVLANDDPATNSIYVVPIRSGLGARLGVNVGYLKFTPRPTWNPF